MAIIETKVDRSSPEFAKNDTHLRSLVKDLQAHLERVAEGGSGAARERHLKRGKLLPRERIGALLDPGSPFLELSALAAYGMYETALPGAGLITGIGQIQGREVMVIANDATVKGGTYYPMTVKKHLRAQEIAAENHLPCLYLVDSGGAYLPMQDQVFPDRDHFGRIFYNQAQMSAQGIPQIAVVMGSCTAGGAYVPAMADETIIVKNQGTIFLGGPPLVRVATGDQVDAEELGGGDVHCRTSGVGDYLVANDSEAMAKARSMIAQLYRDQTRSFYPGAVVEPRYPPEEIYGLIPRDPRYQYHVHEVVARLVDGSDFHEFKALYGKSLVCGFARIRGYQVGILANNGILFSQSALKGTHFIQLCTQRHIPLVFLQNIAGFMVGKQYEHGGIAKDGAKMVHAVACAKVPKFTVIIGGSFGAGNYAMCGRAYGPRLLWMWPNARISVMGGDTAAEVLGIIKAESLQARGESWSEAQQKNFKADIREQYEIQGHPYFATARLWDDGVVDPAETRTVLGLALQAASHAPIEETHYGVFRM
ncbi:carboxyl transferase domain-containing protein [Nitrosococcus wardiae]|uniref:Methylcrotonoyl-CoA carboxylase n=1 Tax=Nitrosococcus wardiae TaxID=1814290 RepID=A0A4P7BZT9_9GAMM|nr:carboxyl transferase domain-containing protein [Nitrosococcus wardiae]QBQ54750.1 methylcrotonoyl-CoA carboxylase [Nitrosococcus wardiae]